MSIKCVINLSYLSGIRIIPHFPNPVAFSLPSTSLPACYRIYDSFFHRHFEILSYFFLIGTVLFWLLQLLLKITIIPLKIIPSKKIYSMNYDIYLIGFSSYTFVKMFRTVSNLSKFQFKSSLVWVSN